ncbi:hypothetical protein CHU98_g3857 [Xylaria longipes]|nr:hypothetical protein CHU98_g3857 [Xylaria longipes]
MPAAPAMITSQPSTESIDSFITGLHIPADTEFLEWCQVLQMDGDGYDDRGLSVLGMRKKLSRDNKKRKANAKGHPRWTPDMINEYQQYKAQCKEITRAKREFEKANSKLEQYEESGGTSAKKLRKLRNEALEKAEAWADAGAGGCKKRLNFMAKFRNVFDPASTTGHIQQAEDNLKSARTAKKAARMFKDLVSSRDPDKTRIPFVTERRRNAQTVTSPT